MKKTVLLISDHDIEAPTADVPILRSLLSTLSRENLSVTLLPKLNDGPVFGQRYFECKLEPFTYRTLLPKMNEKRWYNSRLFESLRTSVRNNYYKRAIRATHASYLVVFAYPNEAIFRALKSSSLPYTWIIYDPFFTQKKFSAFLELETEIAENATSYWVPSYFTEYKTSAFAHTIHYYYFPMLVSRSVILKCLNRRSLKYPVAYFGNFVCRNPNRATRLLSSLFPSHCFSDFPVPKEVEQNWISHKAIYGEEYFQAIANTGVLLVFDNNPEQKEFFPSKIITLIAFGVPILIFGESKNGKLGRFVRGYKNVLYADRSICDDEIIRFVRSSQAISPSFDEESYLRLSCHDEQTVWLPIISDIGRLYKR